MWDFLLFPSSSVKEEALTLELIVEVRCFVTLIQIKNWGKYGNVLTGLLTPSQELSIIQRVVLHSPCLKADRCRERLGALNRLKPGSGPYEEWATAIVEVTSRQVGDQVLPRASFSSHQLHAAEYCNLQLQESMRCFCLTNEIYSPVKLGRVNIQLGNKIFFKRAKGFFKVHLIHLYISQEQNFARSHSVNK